MKILLVEPSFPLPDKSKNHAHFLPIGLLKIGSWHRNRGDRVKLIRGTRKCGFSPDRILITSLFTYWAKSVHDTASFYHDAYPRAKIEIGGIYASLMPDHCRSLSPFAKVKSGLFRGGVAETVPVEFSLLPEELDYQVIHTTRGCPRRCAFCGTWRIEPEFTAKESVLGEIQKRKLVFYDNNLLANPHIDGILQELAERRRESSHGLSCESQSGFDLRLLTPERAALLKEAGFKNPRVAWDGRYDSWPEVRRAVRTLKSVGYGRKDVFVFMIYNHRLPYVEMRKKLDACRRWRVRVIDCRYRPLDCTKDNYRPGPKPQEPGEYYIHPGWTDRQVRRFRRAVRWQNIAILLDLPNGRYIPGCEQRKV
jgi:radical SAM family protein